MRRYLEFHSRRHPREMAETDHDLHSSSQPRRSRRPQPSGWTGQFADARTKSASRHVIRAGRSA
ncbi:MAG: hypothetical protein ACKV0T_18335 [Planctomycetales bacterium]